TSWWPSPFAIPNRRRRVVCGLSETMATLLPQRALTRVDLPTFGRPATATKPDFTAPPPVRPAGPSATVQSHLAGTRPRAGRRAVGAARRARLEGRTPFA